MLPAGTQFGLTKFSSCPAPPTDLKIYPGASGSFVLYDHDGATFRHRNGEWTAIQMTYNDARRTLALQAAHGSPKRTFSYEGRTIHFDGKPQEVKL